MRASEAFFKQSAKALGDAGLTFRSAARRLGPPFASPAGRRPVAPQPELEPFSWREDDQKLKYEDEGYKSLLKEATEKLVCPKPEASATPHACGPGPRAEPDGCLLLADA